MALSERPGGLASSLPWWRLGWHWKLSRGQDWLGKRERTQAICMERAFEQSWDLGSGPIYAISMLCGRGQVASFLWASPKGMRGPFLCLVHASQISALSIPHQVGLPTSQLAVYLCHAWSHVLDSGRFSQPPLGPYSPFCTLQPDADLMACLRPISHSPWPASP